MEIDSDKNGVNESEGPSISTEEFKNSSRMRKVFVTVFEHHWKMVPTKKILEELVKLAEGQLNWVFACEEHCKPTEEGAAGRPHLHYAAWSKKAMTLSQWKLRLGEGHFAVMKATTKKQVVDYMTKEDKDPFEYGEDPFTNSNQGKRNDLDEVKRAIDSGMDWAGLWDNFFREMTKHEKAFKAYIECKKRPKLPKLTIELRTWQEKALKLLDAQNDRQVLFIVDTEGGCGKSTLAKYLCQERDAYMTRGGKHADIAYAYQYEKYACFDMARATTIDYWPWTAIEQLKDGFIFSPKYESVGKKTHPVKVIVFCNTRPDMEKLSNDRYVLMERTAGIWSALQSPSN